MEEIEVEEMRIDETEMEEAERLAEAAENKYQYIHKFNTPVTYEDKTYEKLHFDWGKLTGNDGIAIETEMQMLGTPVVIPSLSGGYLIRMASRASEEKVGIDFLMKLSIRDFNKIRSEARSFLLKSEL